MAKVPLSKIKKYLDSKIIKRYILNVFLMKIQMMDYLLQKKTK